MGRYFRLVLAIVCCELAGLLATPITTSSIPTWYASLEKPFFSPPNWVFGPVWTLLYLLMGGAVWLIWEHHRETKEGRSAIQLFWIQLVLNFSWSIIFFGLRSPLLALIEIVILWVIIFMTMKKFYGLNKTAGYLLVPYLAWVSFATLLNASIVLLNR